MISRFVRRNLKQSVMKNFNTARFSNSTLNGHSIRKISELRTLN